MSSEKVGVRFTTNYDVGNDNHVIGVAGSYKYLGSWDPKHALLLDKRGTKGNWSSIVKLPLSTYFEWKLVLIDKFTREVYRWEECFNRWNWIDKGPIEIIVAWNTKEMIRCSSCRCLVGHCCCTTIYTKLSPPENLIDVTFKVVCNIHDNGTLALIGSSGFLGDWNPAISRIFSRRNNPVLTIDLPMNTSFEYKLAILNSRHRNVVHWEERDNRTLKVQTCPLEVGVTWGQDEKIGHKCSLVDSKWVVLPCPCDKEHCSHANICNEGKRYGVRMLKTTDKHMTEAMFTNTVTSNDPHCLQLDKHIHFSDDPVSDIYEANGNSITSAENIDGQLDIYIGIDGFGLDEIYGNRWATQGISQTRDVSNNDIFSTPIKSQQVTNTNKNIKGTLLHENTQTYIQQDEDTFPGTENVRNNNVDSPIQDGKDSESWFCSKDLFSLEKTDSQKLAKDLVYFTKCTGHAHSQANCDDKPDCQTSKPICKTTDDDNLTVLNVSQMNGQANNSCFISSKIVQPSKLDWLTTEYTKLNILHSNANVLSQEIQETVGDDMLLHGSSSLSINMLKTFLHAIELTTLNCNASLLKKSNYHDYHIKKTAETLNIPTTRAKLKPLVYFQTDEETNNRNMLERGDKNEFLEVTVVQCKRTDDLDLPLSVQISTGQTGSEKLGPISNNRDRSLPLSKLLQLDSEGGQQCPALKSDTAWVEDDLSDLDRTDDIRITVVRCLPRITIMQARSQEKKVEILLPHLLYSKILESGVLPLPGKRLRKVDEHSPKRRNLLQTQVVSNHYRKAIQHGLSKFPKHNSSFIQSENEQNTNDRGWDLSKSRIILRENTNARSNINGLPELRKSIKEILAKHSTPLTSEVTEKDMTTRTTSVTKSKSLQSDIVLNKDNTPLLDTLTLVARPKKSKALEMLRLRERSCNEQIPESKLEESRKESADDRVQMDASSTSAEELTDTCIFPVQYTDRIVKRVQPGACPESEENVCKLTIIGDKLVENSMRAGAVSSESKEQNRIKAGKLDKSPESLFDENIPVHMDCYLPQKEVKVSKLASVILEPLPEKKCADKLISNRITSFSDNINTGKIRNIDKYSQTECSQTKSSLKGKLNWRGVSSNVAEDTSFKDVSSALGPHLTGRTDSRHSPSSLVTLSSIVAIAVVGSCIFDRYFK